MSVPYIWNYNSLTIYDHTNSTYVTFSKALKTLSNADLSYEEEYKQERMRSGKLKKRSRGYRANAQIDLLYTSSDKLDTFIGLINILNTASVDLTFDTELTGFNAGEFLLISKIQLDKLSKLMSAGNKIKLEFEAISLVSAIPTDHATT